MGSYFKGPAQTSFNKTCNTNIRVPVLTNGCCFSVCLIFYVLPKQCSVSRCCSTYNWLLAYCKQTVSPMPQRLFATFYRFFSVLFSKKSGRLLYCGQDEWCHANCALWSAEVYEQHDGSLQKVHSAASRGKMMVSDDDGTDLVL